MGYVTSFKLEVKIGNTDLIEVLRGQNDEAAYALEDDGSTCEGAKWYDHEVDMKAFSSEYPEALFLLSGEGEDSDDIWKKYFKNGRVQVCKAKITFDDFDEKKLV